MPNKTGIEWTDYSSNPIAPVGGGWGCSKVSPGCEHCYAERINKRMGNHRDFQGRWTFILKDKELEAIFRLNNRVKLQYIDEAAAPPTYVFLGDMTDIFHPDVAIVTLEALFRVLASCNRLTFQVLTKRPGRMAYFANDVLGGSWPSNIWAGTSVEQEWDGKRELTARLDLLARVPAKVRFCSYEPVLGPVNFGPWLRADRPDVINPLWGPGDQTLHWIIAGGESGPGARPAHPDWFRQARDQCQAAGVPFFMKQWGEWLPQDECTDEQWSKARERYGEEDSDGWHRWAWVGKKAAGALLDGRAWREMPA